MDQHQTLESLLRDFLTPIIERAVDNAFARYYSAPTAPQPSQNELMNIKDAATFLHLSVPTVYGLVHSRSIPFYKRRQRLYFKKDDLDKWIAGGRRMTVEEIQQAAVESLVRSRRKY